MDKVDIKLLAALEENARVSLKNLARDLNVKTSTIYHRLHKLRESNILERYTIVINPKEIGLTVNKLISIRLKKMVIGKLDTMFLESFAKFLSSEYNEVLFSAVGDDEQIHCILTFRDEDHFAEVEKQIKENPYFESFTCINLENILKGRKLFTFRGDLMKKDDEGEYFDDVGAESEENDAVQEEKNTSEVFF
ncbi:MAG: Lrp/AsnC family transcriptional regulator [Promethearchaeota archaeon]